ncbi:MAG: hypothetical protein ACLGG0_14275 [Bacteriovoracia bacterium]
MKGPVSDNSFHYVVCSHDGIDPEESRQIAESKCLVSAAKLGGVKVKITQKTVQSLTGSDSSEVAEIQPLEVNIKCEWTDRFLEKIKDGFRVWLRCKVAKSSLTTSILSTKNNDHATNKMANRVEATLLISTVPKADRIIIVGEGGERVIEPISNVVTTMVSSYDYKIEVTKHGYKRAIIEIPTNLKHGEKIQRTAVLEKD